MAFQPPALVRHARHSSLLPRSPRTCRPHFRLPAVRALARTPRAQNDAAETTTAGATSAPASLAGDGETGRPLAPCIPLEAAAQITDASAQAMLARLQCTPVPTALPHGAIATAHVHSPAADPRAPAVVFLPGFDSNILEYRFMLPLLDALPAIDAHFVDILGCGLTETRTAPPPPPPAGAPPQADGQGGAIESSSLHFGPAERRAHLAAFIDHCVDPGRPLILAGASLGGAAALDYHLNLDAIKTLSNSNNNNSSSSSSSSSSAAAATSTTSAGGSSTDSARAPVALVLLDAQAFTDRRVGDRPPPLWAARLGARILRSDWLRRLAVRQSYATERLRRDADVLRIGALHCGRPGWEEATVDFIRRDAYCLSERVADTAVPTLVLWGEDDRVMPKGDAERFREIVRDCEVHYVEEAGHSPHIEQPTVVTQRIEDSRTQQQDSHTHMLNLKGR